MENIKRVITENLVWFVAGFIVSMFVIGGIFIPIFGGYALALIGYRRKQGQPILFDARSAIIGVVLLGGISFLFSGDLMYAMTIGVAWGIISGLLNGNGIRMRGL